MRDMDEHEIDAEHDLEAWARFAGGEAGPEPRIPRRRLDVTAWFALSLAGLTVAGMVALWPGDVGADRSRLSTLGVPREQYAAEIVSVDEAPCTGAGDLVCTDVAFRLVAGPDTGAVYTQSFPPSAVNPEFSVGAVAILARRSPNGVVTDVATVACPFDESATCRVLTIAVDEGTGAPRALEYVATGAEPAALLGVGDEAIVDLFPDSDVFEAFAVSPPSVEIAYQFAGDFQRRSLLLWSAVAFAVAVIAVGLWRGVAALGGLVASLGVLLLFVLPAILDGRSPLLVAVVGSSAIAFLALYLAHGFRRMTHVALIGMVSALTLTAVLSAVAVELARFSGFATEESTLLTFFEGIDIRGLLLAGIVLGTAGALDDVTVTQASAVWQLRAADPTQPQREVFRRALAIGRDHIASTVNTLLLAYAGAALPLLILFVLSEQSLGAIANSEVVAVEIIRTLVGSIGLVAAVPITTWLAARTADGSPPH
jgi:uncharacterized membrane protein